jgi:hypothetical protein
VSLELIDVDTVTLQYYQVGCGECVVGNSEPRLGQLRRFYKFMKQEVTIELAVLSEDAKQRVDVKH